MEKFDAPEHDLIPRATADKLAETLDKAYGELLSDSHRDAARCLLLTTIEKALNEYNAANFKQKYGE